MTWEERLYDQQIDDGWLQKEKTTTNFCPECGAQLDCDEDELYASKEGDYIVGCSRCVAVHPAQKKGWEE